MPSTGVLQTDGASTGVLQLGASTLLQAAATGALQLASTGVSQLASTGVLEAEAAQAGGMRYMQN